MVGRVEDELKDRGGILGALPADVEHLPAEPREAVVAVLVAPLGGPAEVELAAVGFDAEADGREGQVEDPGQAAAAQSLASAYASAAAQLSTLDLSPADRATNVQLVTALRGSR